MKGKARHIIYLTAALAMLFYGVPKLELNGPWNAVTIFGVVWTLFALVVIAAHLNALLWMNEQKKKQLERIKQAKRNNWERRLQQVVNRSSNRRARG
ncbi:hypothetical protein [Paenibacillus glycanilyticus]|uniref:2TM domain-containing protein n=1 Tax=Paenibacillus glycanilyticus TaxID=126569 RepID=A0ABQ6GIY9_9BACL|nr:hypothetical protein [Paenibacillus glycanilyticus]GLX69602.1 hypothetical protein MU1_39470 [Paenibacillus glycanilyticus]